MSEVRRAVVVEDVPALRAAMRTMLEGLGYSVDEVATRADGLRLAEDDAEVAIVLVDLGLPDGSGIDVVRGFARRHPETSIVVCTIFDDDAHVFPSLAAGAHGYLLKDSPPGSWAAALQELEQGRPPLSPSIARRILAHFRSSSALFVDEPGVALTPRELDVLGLIGRGLRIGEAATTLGLAESTVAGYVKDIYRKLGISNRAEAALEASRRGLT